MDQAYCDCFFLRSTAHHSTGTMRIALLVGCQALMLVTCLQFGRLVLLGSHTCLLVCVTCMLHAHIWVCVRAHRVSASPIWLS
jgi:hypothetical protein